MRIAKPILLVTTPSGVCWGIIEAARFHVDLPSDVAVSQTFNGFALGQQSF